jgi:hypothetical protein
VEQRTGKKGLELVRELEKSLGNKVQKPNDDSYDLLVQGGSGQIHGEVKTTDSANGRWSLNGTGALRRLISDPNYRLYFCLLEPPTVMRCNGLFLRAIPLLLTAQNPPDLQKKIGKIKSSKEAILQKLETLENVLTDLKALTGMGADCKFPFSLPFPVGDLFSLVIDVTVPRSELLRVFVDGIWRREDGKWRSLVTA